MQQKLLIFILLTFITPYLYAQSFLQKQIESLIQGKNAKVGVAISFNGNKSLTINDNTSYAMMSTFKFPVALAVLHHLDQQGLPLTTGIFVSKSDLLPDTYSPLRDACPEGEFRMPVSDLIKYSVALSDNNACDILIKYLGGTEKVQQYIEQAGIRHMKITATEEMMHQKSENQYANQTKPSSAVLLLDKFLSKILLSPVYQEFLEKTMIATSTGSNKLKGLLPATTVVGHKTGSSDRNQAGLKIGDNDMGFVYLPDGKHYSIAVFIMDSMEEEEMNAAIIAEISKAVYDYYNK